MQNFIPVFRGKTLDGRWVEGSLVREAFDGTSRTIPVGIQSPRCYPVEVLPETIGMSTGKTDKNGNMIFGGDIVLDAEYHGSGQVEFRNGSFKMKSRKSSWQGIGSWSKRLEITGNTTDNSDLLSNQ